MNRTSSVPASGRRTLWETVVACSGTAADRRNQYRVLVWCLIWAIGFVAAAWALRSTVGLDARAAWAVALAPMALSIPPLLAYLRFLRSTDELLRKIQLEGLALGFGAGAILGLGYPLLERIGAPPLSPSTTVAVMMIAWAIGQLLGALRYR